MKSAFITEGKSQIRGVYSPEDMRLLEKEYNRICFF